MNDNFSGGISKDNSFFLIQKLLYTYKINTVYVTFLYIKKSLNLYLQPGIKVKLISLVFSYYRCFFIHIRVKAGIVVSVLGSEFRKFVLES